jgi:hypothetical protein
MTESEAGRGTAHARHEAEAHQAHDPGYTTSATPPTRDHDLGPHEKFPTRTHKLIDHPEHPWWMGGWFHHECSCGHVWENGHPLSWCLACPVEPRGCATSR